MKKLLTLLASLSLFLLVACGESTTEEVKTEVKKDLETEKAEVEEEKEKVTEEAEEEANEEDSTEESEELNEVLAYDDLVKITLINVVKVTDEIFGDSIKVNFEIENRYDNKIIVQTRDVSIDGYMADDIASMSAEVMPGKKAKESLTFDEMFLDEGEELPKLEENLEMSLLVINDETWDDLAEYPVNLEF